MSSGAEDDEVVTFLSDDFILVVGLKEVLLAGCPKPETVWIGNQGRQKRGQLSLHLGINRTFYARKN